MILKINFVPAKIFTFSAIFLLIIVAGYSQKAGFKIVNIFRIASPGGWDYLAVNKNKLYVSHGTQVNVLDKATGDSLGIIEHTAGVHGIAFVNDLNRGFTSNGKANNVTVFDLDNNKTTGEIAVGQNPDAILYDGYSKKIYTCNGRSSDMSVIDPAAGKVVATIALGGKPEEAIADNEGKLFVNIEDKSEIVEINTQTYKITNRWPLAPGRGPTGLAYDKKSKRLFSACDNQLLMVLSAETGKKISQLPIGEGCDGTAFDSSLQNIYTSNGEGTVTVIHENSANDFKVADTIKTKTRARTIALDIATHWLYLPTAEFEKPAANAPKNERPKMIAGTFQVLVIAK